MKKQQRYDNSSAAWRKRFSIAEKHPGGVQGYCRESGIRLDRYYYWRRRIKPLTRAEGSSAAPFARIEVEKASTGSAGKLPDPRWLAEFLLALGAEAAR